VRVISKKRLKEFWRTPNNAGAEGPLTAWYNVVNSKTTDWQGWGDVRSLYGTADTVGNCVVFDIGGNK
jgi:mRNA interferase HigB